MVIAILQARVGSSRLPGKMLKTIKGKTLLELYINRVLPSQCIDQIVVATTTLPIEFDMLILSSIICRDGLPQISASTFLGSLDEVIRAWIIVTTRESFDKILSTLIYLISFNKIKHKVIKI